MEKVESKTLKQREASEIFDLSLKHTQRLIRALRKGIPTLVQHLQGRSSKRRVFVYRGKH